MNRTEYNSNEGIVKEMDPRLQNSKYLLCLTLSPFSIFKVTTKSNALSETNIVMLVRYLTIFSNS